MAIKKSELYSSLWASCDELRGGMDASQYKDYVLVMLFVKYVSDKYTGQPYAPIKIPEGSSFRDMVALKGKDSIGDDINKKIIGPIAEANKLSEMPDFNNPDKLGSGKDMVTKLTNLITIFENPALDFSSNRAEGDDILGDAYEYLMRHFAAESGKSKGQFYTPAEVSRVMAKIIGINSENATAETSVYDPTCGSGSLLLKIADEAERLISLFGQEMDVATASLSRMNMILHNNPTAVIRQGNTLANPLFKDSNGRQETFDYVVANPPFSFKSWSNGVNITEELQPGGRFHGLGVPPAKNGDYAFLLHILRSLRNTGKGAVILPHGVLFRGNTEAEIRKNLIQKRYIKGIIGLPPNLFYGTGIPACIIVMDKEGASKRKHIFMMDASKGFIKDGNKNRLREKDIHKIVDIFNKQTELPKFSRLVSLEEISDPKNDFNLNIPRYIDSQEADDIQDIEAHLLGGIPNADIEALSEYWEVYKTLKGELFSASKRHSSSGSGQGYSDLRISKDNIKQTIFSHPEFVSFSKEMDDLFADWKIRNSLALKALTIGIKPKQTIFKISEDLLATYKGKALMDKYDVYQHLMNYWNEVMQDDCYLIAADGWKAEISIIKQTKTATEWDCELVPKTLVIDRYFLTEKKAIEIFEADKEIIATQITELEEEHNTEEGCFADFDKVSKANVQKRLKAIDTPKLKGDNTEEIEVLKNYLRLIDDQVEISRKIKEAIAELDKKLMKRYKTLNENEIKQLVVDDKWMASIERSVKTEMERISHRLTQRIKELADRYEKPMPQLTKEVDALTAKVEKHLKQMKFKW